MSGFLGAIAAGIGGAADAGADMMMKQIESDIAQQREQALIQAREASQMRVQQGAEDIRQSGRKADFAFDTDPANVQAKADAASSITKATTLAQGEAQTQVEKDRGNDKGYIAAKRAEALAQHIVDPQVSLVPASDGRLMKVDVHSGKQLGYLQDPATGKDFQGSKDISQSTLTIAKSYMDEGTQLAKDGDTEGAQEKFQMGRDLLSGNGQGAKQDAIVGGVVIGKAATWKEAQALASAYKAKQTKPPEQTATPTKPTGIINATIPQKFNEAGYSSVEGTIDGAARGDKRAKALVQRWIDSGGDLTAQQKVRAMKTLGQS